MDQNLIFTVGIQTLTMYGAISIGTGLVLILATSIECGKYDITSSFTNAAISGIFPSVIYFLAAMFDFIRRPFVDTFAGFGIQEPAVTKVGIGYMIILALLPITVWAAKDATTKACVASVDEMSKFKTGLMAKLKAKKDKEIENAKPQH